MTVEYIWQANGFCKDCNCRLRAISNPANKLILLCICSANPQSACPFSQELNRFAEPNIRLDFLILEWYWISTALRYRESGEVRRPCSKCRLEGRGQLKLHDHSDDRVRRTRLL